MEYDMRSANDRRYDLNSKTISYTFRVQDVL